MLLVTILAFVYVPLNLATSIFGMNLEQLNGSGQHLSVFITTAVVALAVTRGSWFSIEQVNSYRKWRNRGHEEQYDGNTQFALSVRLAMLAFLVSNWDSLWVFKSGAWWRILVNNRSRVYNEWIFPEEDRGRWNTGELVSKYGRESPNWLFFPRTQWRNPTEDCN